MNNRKIAYCLLMFWLMQCSIVPLLYQIGRWNCQLSNIAIQLNTSNHDLLKHFTFKQYATICWEENDKEFLLDGKLYDVLQIVSKNGSIEITCLPDTAEDAVLLAFHQQTNHKSDTGKTVKIWDDLKCIVNYIEPKCIGFELKKSISIFRMSHYLNNCFKLNVPPPEVV